MDPIRQILVEEDSYPKLLSQIADPPKQLYCRGNLELLNSECIAVVGTRKLTSYGREAAQKITTGLVQAGFTIVSGLAMGIDAVAHQTTLDNDGKTIAVLGGGVSDQKIGPRVNLPLAQKILKNKGLLVSEYSDEEEIFAPNFAVRDRIISGLSRGVLVIEAAEGSGALITAKCALDQNRDVFAVPGSIFSSKSFGPNTLISNGAKLVSTAQDITDEYGYNLNVFSKSSNTISTKNPTEKTIIAILEKRGETTTDEIIRESTEETSKVMAAISTLEIKGVIKDIGNGKYRKN